MTEIQEPKFLQDMKGPARWEWFDRQKAIMADAVAKGGTVNLEPELLQGFVYMMSIQDLKYCEVVTMHHNTVVTMACAAIENDIDSMSDWLLNALDRADCAEWQMYESAQEFYKRNQLPWPSSQAEHRENLKAIKAIEKEDAKKFEAWYEENVQGELK